MASTFPGQVSAVQVGTYFVGQYYQILQQRPDCVHQFYNEMSAMTRIDGDATETATGLMQIHNLIMSLNFIGIEIKTAHSQDSWNGGVLVMMSGYVQTKNYDPRRKFVQTFFLAPQEKGFFVLNDIFHFLEEEEVPHYTTSMLAHGSFETKLNASTPVAEQASEYMMGGEAQPQDYVDQGFTSSGHAEENDTIDDYGIPEQQQQLSEPDSRIEETHLEDPVASFSSAVNTVRDPPPAMAEEPVGEQPKQTYASILRAKGQSGNSVPYPILHNSTPVVSEWQQPQQPQSQQSYPVSSMGTDKFPSEAVEEFAIHDDESEAKSVYLGNLPSTISVSDLEQEFKNFGRLKPDGVTIRNRKEAGVYYAFVEFEDAIGVQNALKASPVEVNGRQIHVEGRRPNSGIFRGRRGRGRGGYQSESLRGRFSGRMFARSGGQDNGDREYNSRPRGNGFLHRGPPRQDRGILGNQVSRNGQNLYEAPS